MKRIAKTKICHVHFPHIYLRPCKSTKLMLSSRYILGESRKPLLFVVGIFHWNLHSASSFLPWG